MNKTNIFFMILLVFVSATTFSKETVDIRETFLENYFQDSSFEIRDQVKINGDDVFLVVTYANKERRIVDRAILLSSKNGQFSIYLYIEKDKLQNANGEIILKTTSDAYGWNLRIINSETIKIWLDFYHGDSGINVADSFRIKWNQSENRFEFVKIDTSQY